MGSITKSPGLVYICMTLSARATGKGAGCSLRSSAMRGNSHTLMLYLSQVLPSSWLNRLAMYSTSQIKIPPGKGGKFVRTEQGPNNMATWQYPYIYMYTCHVVRSFVRVRLYHRHRHTLSAWVAHR